MAELAEERQQLTAALTAATDRAARAEARLGDEAPAPAGDTPKPPARKAAARKTAGRTPRGEQA